MTDSGAKVRGLVDGSPSAGSVSALSASERVAWDSLVRGGWHLYAAINQGLSDAGMPATQDWRVLESLSKHERLRISDLASITQISLSTVSRQITRLVDAGRVERLDVDHDARQRWVRLTAEGTCYLGRVAQVRDQLVREHLIDVLTPEEFESLGVIFGKVFAALEGRGES